MTTSEQRFIRRKIEGAGLLIGLNALDVITTSIGFRTGEIEGSRFMSPIINMHGIEGLIITKAIGIGAILSLIAYFVSNNLRDRKEYSKNYNSSGKTLGLINGIFAYTVASNILGLTTRHALPFPSFLTVY